MTTVERVVGNLNFGRCVGIEIFNNTENVTLENPRTYCKSGNVWMEPTPEIPPGGSGSSVFVKKGRTACGSVGVLSYESNIFTLAIMFSNPFNYNLYNIEFALQLCSGRQQFDSMERLYSYMHGGGPPYQCHSFRKAVLRGWNPGELRVRNQEIEVKATMTSNYKSYIRVQIEQTNPSPP
nr:DELTA-thalatoxin-Avl1a-like [Pelodiscus sinensis]|eukprot:XP_014427498.1 DELTA-thalatoxin-Avl1a-like [Pelodiscus sinensis]